MACNCQLIAGNPVPLHVSNGNECPSRGAPGCDVEVTCDAAAVYATPAGHPGDRRRSVQATLKVWVGRSGLSTHIVHEAAPRKAASNLLIGGAASWQVTIPYHQCKPQRALIASA
jgi:hypothetical protein